MNNSIGAYAQGGLNEIGAYEHIALPDFVGILASQSEDTIAAFIGSVANASTSPPNIVLVLRLPPHNSDIVAVEGVPLSLRLSLNNSDQLITPDDPTIVVKT